MPPVIVEQMQLCIDAEIARARLHDLIEGCHDADVLWISDVIQQAFSQAALAARAAEPSPHPMSCRPASEPLAGIPFQGSIE